MKEHPTGRAMAQNLLWGYYRDGELQTAFALKEDGSVLDGKGESVSPESFADETGKIGLVHPEELTEVERNFWKKYAGKEKWKQPFPQLKIPACQGQYDLSAFIGIQVTQLFMITAAGKWGCIGEAIRTNICRIIWRICSMGMVRSLSLTVSGEDRNMDRRSSRWIKWSFTGSGIF